MKKWFANRSSKCEPVENYLSEPSDDAMEIVMTCASAGPAEVANVMKYIKQIITGHDGKRASVGLHLLSLMVLGNETVAQAIATPKWMQRLVNLAKETTKAFIRQQVTASVAKWTSRYVSHPTLFVNFEWANSKLNSKFEPQGLALDLADEAARTSNEPDAKSATDVKSSSIGAGVAGPIEQSLIKPQLSSNRATTTSKLSDSIAKIRESIKAAIETTEWSDAQKKGTANLLRRGSFSSINPGSPQVNSGSAIVDEQRGRVEFLCRCLQQVPSLMTLNDITLDDMYNPNAIVEDLAEDIEILENFQADVKAIAGWNVLNKDNDEHLVLLQCSYLFSETARLWRKKMTGADMGNVSLDTEHLLRPGSADKKRHGKLDTSVAKDALTALETKQILEKRIQQMTKEIVAFENDIMRLQAKLAENEFMSQSKTATFEETIATLLDENASLKAEFQSISKIPREKLLLWTLKEKEMDKAKESEKSITKKIAPLQQDASKPESIECQRLEEGQSSSVLAEVYKCTKLEIELQESRTQLQECQDKLNLKCEEVLLMQLKMKEGGSRLGKQIEQNAYILKLEDTITSLSEELSCLKHDLDSEKDASRHRMDEISSQLLLKHQQRFLSDRNSLIATHGKLMSSLVRMSGNFATEIRGKLLILRGNVSKNQQLLASDVAEAIQKLQLLSLPAVATHNHRLDKKYNSLSLLETMSDREQSTSLFGDRKPADVTESPNATPILESNTGCTDVSEAKHATNVVQKKGGFFSSLFGKVSPAKGDNPQSSKSPSDKTHLVPGTPSATAHLKTVFAQVKGAVEAKEANQLRLSAEAHAVALAKVEEEWAAAATAKAKTEAEMLENEVVAKAQFLNETSAATKSKITAQSRTVVERHDEASSTHAAQVHGVLKSESESFIDEINESTCRMEVQQDVSDVSSFSDDHEIVLEKEEMRFENSTTCVESVDLSNSIIAATLAMIKPQSGVVSSVSKEGNIVSPGFDPIPRKVCFQLEGNSRLQDRPASAVEIRSNSSPAESAKVSFLNDVVFEDTGHILQNRVAHNSVALRSGRKVLAGTSKLVRDGHHLTKEAYGDTPHLMSSVEKQGTSGQGLLSSAELGKSLATETKVRITRVGPRSRFITSAEDESHPAPTAAYQAASQNLKTIRNRMALVQMPNADAGFLRQRFAQDFVIALKWAVYFTSPTHFFVAVPEASRLNAENESSTESLEPTRGNIMFQKSQSTADLALSLLDSQRSDIASFRDGLKIPEFAYSNLSPAGNQTTASEKRGLNDWNVEDL